MSAREGLVVVVPRGCPTAHAEDVVRSKARWIERAFARLGGRRDLYRLGSEGWLPDLVDLRALGDVYPVEYRAADGHKTRAAVDEDGVLGVVGDIDDADACLKALRAWFDEIAKRTLPAWLERTSREQGLAIGGVSVRGQRTRWASCSSKGAIALNRALMFLPPALVEHVMVHELCHTLHGDHSTGFWSEVAARDASYAENRRLLRSAWELVPTWAGGG